MPQRVLWKQSFVCWHVSASLWLRHIMSERSWTFFCNYCLFETYRSSAYMPRLTCESWWVYDRIKCFTFHMLSILLFYILTCVFCSFMIPYLILLSLHCYIVFSPHIAPWKVIILTKKLVVAIDMKHIMFLIHYFASTSYWSSSNVVLVRWSFTKLWPLGLEK